MYISLPIIIFSIILSIILMGVLIYMYYKYIKADTIYSFDGTGNMSTTWNKQYGPNLLIKFDIVTPLTTDIGPIMFIGNLGTAVPGECTATFDQPCSPYSYILLNGSKIEFVFGTKTNGLINLKTNDDLKINDGNWHSITIQRSSKDDWTLNVDEKEQQSINKTITETIPSSKLYLGTTPSDIIISGASPLKACIKNFSINGTVLNNLTPSGTVAIECKYIKPPTYSSKNNNRWRLW